MKKYDSMRSQKEEIPYQYSPILLIWWLRGVKILSEDIPLKEFDKWPWSYDSDTGRASTTLPTSKRSLAISASKHKFDNDTSEESTLEQELSKWP